MQFYTPEFKGLFEVYQLLSEGSKLQILKDKLLLDDYTAETFDTLFKGKAVIMANKFIVTIEKAQQRKLEIDPKTGKRELETWTRRYHTKLIGIRDWIDVGLNGQLGDWQNKGDIEDLFHEAEQWHTSLENGDGEVNYKEQNPIILDFRDRTTGLGFYWCDLQTSNCGEESDRMGHCGRTGAETLYSLREYKKHINNTTLNQSHLTAAMDHDGTMYQMKGPHNTKPEKQYHPYIVALIEAGYLTDIKSEYDSGSDFKLYDLGKDAIEKLYKKMPNAKLFNTRQGARALRQLGIIKEIPKMPVEVIEMDIDDLINQGLVSFKYFSPENVNNMLTGENGSDYMFDSLPSEEEIFDNFVHPKNKKKIEELLNKHLEKKGITALEVFGDVYPVPVDINELFQVAEESRMYGFNQVFENADYEDLLYAIRDAYVHAWEVAIYDDIKGEIIDTLKSQYNAKNISFHQVTRTKYSYSQTGARRTPITYEQIVISFQIDDLNEILDEDTIDETIESWGSDDPFDILVNAVSDGAIRVDKSRYELSDSEPSKEEYNRQLGNMLDENF